MATFTFELVSPERVLFSGDVDAVVLPATEGDMTVLAGHSPVMTTLRPGSSSSPARPATAGGFSSAAASPTSIRTASRSWRSARFPRRS